MKTENVPSIFIHKQNVYIKKRSLITIITDFFAKKIFILDLFSMLFCSLLGLNKNLHTNCSPLFVLVLGSY